ncbi:hypothetical protein AB0D10_36125 [Kitasatospora sp. NPDC048545]|uniref:hypothetical protein n=1 Tax=Kitasatospora sp. NPDC048545 TaxID=3157208 RepID=UPI0033F9A347
MTHDQTDGASSADAAARYLEALRERLAADGCRINGTGRPGHRVVIGSRSDRKARWFATKVELFVLAAAVPEVDGASLAEFTGWALGYAKDLRSGLAGVRNAAMVLPALISDRVHPSAVQWAAADGRVLGTDLIARPVVVETAATGGARTTVYRGRAAWGGMFTSHVLTKASLYFP